MQAINATTFKQDVIKNTDFILEVGDLKQTGFLPQTKLMRWGNDANYSQRLTGFGSGSFVESNGIITWTNNLNTVQCIYSSSDDNFSYKVILLEKPSSNKLTFSLSVKNLEASKAINPFAYPEFNARYVTQNGVEGVEYDSPDGSIAFTSVENVSSYSFWHDSKMHNDHQSGKAFQMPRPQAIDINNGTAWVELDINIALKVLTQTIPQTFLDSAVYPVEI